MRTTFREIADFMDPVRSVNSVRELVRIHREATSARNELTLGGIFDRHESTANELKLLFYNTFLLPGVQMQTWCQYARRRLITNLLEVEGKPNRSERAIEMARAFQQENYDYVFLSEVFEDDVKTILTNELERNYETIDVASGPSFNKNYLSIPKAPFIGALTTLPASHHLLPLIATIEAFSCPPFARRQFGAELLNSGLFSVGLSSNFESSSTYEFQNRGNMMKDADYFSSKGVLKTSVQMNIGTVDIYSTHLYAGGKFISDKFISTEEEKRTIRLSQVRELLAFARTSSDPTHIRIIVGDFNIDGMDLNDSFYEDFITLMNNAGFDDIWVQRCVNEENELVLQPTGNTNDDICEVNGNRCNELFTDFPEQATRIDYIFIERQTNEHSFILDYTRPIRIPFPNTEISDDSNFLSDHLGLELTLKPSTL